MVFLRKLVHRFQKVVILVTSTSKKKSFLPGIRPMPDPQVFKGLLRKDKNKEAVKAKNPYSRLIL